MGRTVQVLAGAMLAVLVALGGGACGKDAPPPKPAAVPDGLVPDAVQGGSYAFYESTLPQVKSAFANAGKNSLVADGRMWELRKADRLVGILQVSTLVPTIDLLNDKHRQQVISQILPTARDRVTVGDVTVFVSTANQKSVFLWFSDQTFHLLTIKPGSGDDLDPEAVMTEVLDHETQSVGWKPIYFDDGGDL
jgi:hypothetical protein